MTALMAVDRAEATRMCAARRGCVHLLATLAGVRACRRQLGLVRLRHDGEDDCATEDAEECGDECGEECGTHGSVMREEEKRGSEWRATAGDKLNVTWAPVLLLYCTTDGKFGAYHYGRRPRERRWNSRVTSDISWKFVNRQGSKYHTDDRSRTIEDGRRTATVTAVTIHMASARRRTLWAIRCDFLLQV